MHREGSRMWLSPSTVTVLFTSAWIYAISTKQSLQNDNSRYRFPLATIDEISNLFVGGTNFYLKTNIFVIHLDGSVVRSYFQLLVIWLTIIFYQISYKIYCHNRRHIIWFSMRIDI